MSIVLSEHEGQVDYPLAGATYGTHPLEVLRLAFDGARHGFAVTDDGGTILFVNEALLRIFAYPAGSLTAQPLSWLLPGPTGTADDYWTEFWSHPPISSATIAHRTIVGLRKDGVLVPLDVSLNRLVEGTNGYVIASFVDISDRVNLEARLVAATNAHLGFQRLVADVAVRFGAIAPDAVDAAILESLGNIGEALQLDCASIWRKQAGAAVAEVTHHWGHEQCTSEPAPIEIASIPFAASALEAGNSCSFTSLTDLVHPSDREFFSQGGLRSGVVIPLTAGDEHAGGLTAMFLGSTTREQEWVPAIVERLRLVGGVIGQAFARQASEAALKRALGEVRQLRDRLASENVELRQNVKMLRTSRPVVSESPTIQRVLALIAQVAPTPATVLLMGETGTGKEVMAQALHDLSPRHQRQMIRVSCAAIPTALIESELFGRERGAYTGALSRQIGRFEAANQSTLFLDEIGDLPMEVQVKLLRVLQERVIERLGSTQPIKVDVRIIAATNRDLEDLVRDKLFREDLFYRLNVFPVVVPPLRERVEDIAGLVWSFIDEFSRLFGKSIDSLSKESLRELQSYPWPGNVRELRNVIERAVIVATGRQLVVSAPRIGDRPMPQAAMTLSALEVNHIRAVLDSTNWRVRGAGGAAERLGLKPTTLESRMARFGITRKKAS